MRRQRRFRSGLFFDELPADSPVFDFAPHLFVGIEFGRVGRENIKTVPADPENSGNQYVAMQTVLNCRSWANAAPSFSKGVGEISAPKSPRLIEESYSSRRTNRSINGCRMISMAKPILPPGTTMVLRRDMNES